MSLCEIPIELGKFPLSEKADSLIWEGNRRVEKFYEAGQGQKCPRFIPSDSVLVWESISFLRSNGHVRGDVFCEWGCGFGIATGLASLLGMTASGMEIEDELVDRATQLMKDLDFSVEILRKSFLPEGFEVSEKEGKKNLVRPKAIHPQEADLIFAYPWPDEEGMMKDLFPAIASEDAILLLYLGDGKIVAFKKEKK